MTTPKVATPTIEEIADSLEKAADLIETVGFCQRKARATDKDGKITGYCLMGALHDAFGLYRYEGNKRHFSSVWKYQMTGRNYAIDHIIRKIQTQIPIWNDEPGRTASEVIDLLKHAAKDLRNKEVHNG
jgi:hypothetical protein